MAGAKDGVDKVLTVLEEASFPEKITDSVVVKMASSGKSPLTMYGKTFMNYSKKAQEGEDRRHLTAGPYAWAATGSKNMVVHYQEKDGLMALVVVNKRKQKPAELKQEAAQYSAELPQGFRKHWLPGIPEKEFPLDQCQIDPAEVALLGNKVVETKQLLPRYTSND